MKLSISLERANGPRYVFSVPSAKGELRGEVDDSATAPLYAVQHCVVDTSTGQIVQPPTHDKSRVEEVAARLNRMDEVPSREPRRL